MRRPNSAASKTTEPGTHTPRSQADPAPANHPSHEAHQQQRAGPRPGPPLRRRRSSRSSSGRCPGARVSASDPLPPAIACQVAAPHRSGRRRPPHRRRVVARAAGPPAAAALQQCKLLRPPQPVRECGQGDKPALHAAMMGCQPLCMRGGGQAAARPGAPAGGGLAAALQQVGAAPAAAAGDSPPPPAQPSPAPSSAPPTPTHPPHRRLAWAAPPWRGRACAPGRRRRAARA
jgi:hypothetical protein